MRINTLFQAPIILRQHIYLSKVQFNHFPFWNSGMCENCLSKLDLELKEIEFLYSLTYRKGCFLPFLDTLENNIFLCSHGTAFISKYTK